MATIYRYLAAGACAAACLAVAAIAGAGQPFYRIVAYMDENDQPGSLVEGAPGLFYGIAGGYTHVVFSITAAGAQTVLASFPSGNNIGSALVAASNGRLYSSVEPGNHPATIFSLAPGSDRLTYAAQPYALALTQGLPDGNLLGLAAGLSGTPWYVVTSDLNGAVKMLAQFPPAERLTGSVIFASDGNSYGIAQGATSSTGYVFRVSPQGSVAKLHAFPESTFLSYLPAPLLQSSGGELYGAIPTGGAHGAGFIYKLTLDGQYSLLFDFPKGDTGAPTALIEASDGSLYGATRGNFNLHWTGALFRLTKSGRYTLLHQLSNPTRDGACPCDILQASDGILYGTAQGGGRNGAGAIFALDVALPKPRPRALSFSPESGPPGTRVRIWGQNLLAASVKFHGSPAAAVTPSGPNYVWATVPTGATAGPITVTTPGGTTNTRTTFTPK